MVDQLITKWQRLVAFILARLTESSTIQGLAAIATLATGVVVDGTNLAAWVAIAAGVSAILKIFLPDNWTKEQ